MLKSKRDKLPTVQAPRYLSNSRSRNVYDYALTEQKRRDGIYFAYSYDSEVSPDEFKKSFTFRHGSQNE
jgi:hypothetical protein